MSQCDVPKKHSAEVCCSLFSKVAAGTLWWFPVETFQLFFRSVAPESHTSDPSSLVLGPTERSRPYFGQQAGREGLDVGGGDLPVPHARLHLIALLARSGLLRPDRRGVSLRPIVCTSTRTSLHANSRWNDSPRVCSLSLIPSLPASLNWMKSHVVAN